LPATPSHGNCRNLVHIHTRTQLWSAKSGRVEQAKLSSKKKIGVYLDGFQ
jgi:hypothetical protein